MSNPTNLTEKYILDLIENETPEGDNLEYKQIVDNGDNDKKEFLADVSAFANAHGGRIIYGIVEKDGLPSEIRSILADKIDHEVQRLNNIIAAGISPKLNCKISPVTISPDKTVLVIEIPKSWNGPHMVIFKDTNKFYLRKNNSKRLMDVDEIRISFTHDQNLKNKINNFRMERASVILNGELEPNLSTEGIVLVHVIPLEKFKGHSCDLKNVYAEPENNISLMYSWGWNYRKFNFDGLMYYVTHDKRICVYSQIFHDGCIEGFYSNTQQDKVNFACNEFEIQISHYLKKCIDFQKKSLRNNPPYLIFLSMLNVKNHLLISALNEEKPFNKNDMFFGGVIMNDHEEDIRSLMKPIFDQVHNAAGYMGSPSYNKDGKWVHRPI
jgi:hypothetical protein